MFWLYNLVLTLTSPLWVTFMILRSRKRKPAPNWQERQGQIEVNLPAAGKRIWIHAASVGETIAAVPVVRELKATDPTCVVFFTVTTSSGHQTATDQLVKTGLIDQLSYFPIDVLRFVLAGLTRVRPDVVAIMETELWFNFLWGAKTMGARTVLINGRLSDRSFDRGRWVRFFYQSMLPKLDRVLVQTEVDAERFKFMGAASAEVLGNTKYDEADQSQPITKETARELLGIPMNATVIVVGSTRGSFEQEWVVQALAPFMADDNLWVVHAPRHVETADALAALAESTVGTAARRSKNESGRYLILDTYGELGWAYSSGDIAIIGGGFDRLGGQNLIQPLASGLPVIRGPHFQNFAAVAAQAEREGLTRTAATPDEIGQTVRELLDNPERRLEMGSKARAFVEAQRGAAKRYALEILAEAVRTTVKRRQPKA